MPLDPQAREVLDRLAAVDLPPIEQQSPARAREIMLLRTIGLGEPPAIASMEDRRVPVDGGEIDVRVYRPATEGELPVLVYFHGGGWVIGCIRTHDALCRALANASGFAVVAVDYRLAPEHRYPTAVEDCWAATRWVADNAEELGVDPHRLVVGGDSAGGNLAAVVALLARDRGGLELAGQILVYPITDCDLDTPSSLTNAEGYNLTRAAMRWFWDHYLPEEKRRKEPLASPLQADSLAGLAPALVQTAEFDPLRDEGEAYAHRLIEAGVDATLTRYDGLIHGYIRMTGQIDRAQDANDEIVAALKRFASL